MATYRETFSTIFLSETLLSLDTYTPVIATRIMPIIALTITAFLSFIVRNGMRKRNGRIDSIIAVTIAEVIAFLDCPVAVSDIYIENASAKELLILNPTTEETIARKCSPEDHTPRLIPKTVIALLTTPKLIPCLKAFV